MINIDMKLNQIQNNICLPTTSGFLWLITHENARIYPISMSSGDHWL